jgi:molybdopterin synthase catalytic subunit
MRPRDISAHLMRLNVHIPLASYPIETVTAVVRFERTGIDKKGTVRLTDLLELARKNPEAYRAGAIVTFSGIVRGHTREGKKVDKLELDAYDELAEKALEKISSDLRNRKGVVDVLIHHLIGTFDIGDDLVYVVVLADSRENAFSTAREAVERYKKEAAVWKKEYLADGTSQWVKE